MTKTLEQWERVFEEQLKVVPMEKRDKAGALLSVIPNHTDWDEFLNSIKEEWWMWGSRLIRYPHCLAVLYGGLAFFKYDNNTFWRHFAEATGYRHNLPGNQQTEINGAYAEAAFQLDLKILKRSGTQYSVGSAVYHVGIPLSLWEGFLDICEWALWQRHWKEMSDEQWIEVVTQRAGGRQRLKSFLIDNREVATEFISEMLDARAILERDEGQNIDEWKRACRIRQEYFDEVPETADFLRPDDPDSLLKNQARLFWARTQQRISIFLPPVSNSDLPGEWHFNSTTRNALSTADEIPINSAAFQNALNLKFISPRGTEVQRLLGLEPWGLFDLVKERFVNTTRTKLPLSQYALISKQPLAQIQIDGWSDNFDENPQNRSYQLADGQEFFVTELWPVANRAKLKISGGEWLHFGRRHRVALRFFGGCEDSHVFRFALGKDEIFKAEKWPQLVLEIPKDFLEDSIENFNREFQVLADGKTAEGTWQFYEEDEKEELDYYCWRWANPAKIGQHEISIKSARLGILPLGKRKIQPIEILSPTPDNFWPGRIEAGNYLIWVLLSAVQDDACWEEMCIARSAVAGLRDVKLSQIYYEAMKLEQQGYLFRRHQWQIRRAGIVFNNNIGNSFHAKYTGLTNRLYSVIRGMPPLKKLEVKQERGCPPHLEILWPAHQRSHIRSLCEREGISVLQQNSLWTH